MDFYKLDINTLIKLAALKYLASRSVTVPPGISVNDAIKRALVEYLNAS